MPRQWLISILAQNSKFTNQEPRLLYGLASVIYGIFVWQKLNLGEPSLLRSQCGAGGAIKWFLN